MLLVHSGWAEPMGWSSSEILTHNQTCQRVMLWVLQQAIRMTPPPQKWSFTNCFFVIWINESQKSVFRKWWGGNCWSALTSCQNVTYMQERHVFILKKENCRKTHDNQIWAEAKTQPNNPSREKNQKPTNKPNKKTNPKWQGNKMKDKSIVFTVNPHFILQTVKTARSMSQFKECSPPHCQGTRDNVRLNWQITV